MGLKRAIRLSDPASRATKVRKYSKQRVQRLSASKTNKRKDISHPHYLKPTKIFEQVGQPPDFFFCQTWEIYRYKYEMAGGKITLEYSNETGYWRVVKPAFFQILAYVFRRHEYQTGIE